jgi:hypothetical protein
MRCDAGDWQAVAYDGENGHQQEERCHSALPMDREAAARMAKQTPRNPNSNGEIIHVEQKSSYRDISCADVRRIDSTDSR